VTGKSLVNYSALTKPNKLQAVTDPDFGTRIVRITDVLADWNAKVAIPAYPTTQAWNSDETRFVLYVTSSNGSGAQTGYALFDGGNYHFLRWLPINPADVEQFYWSRSEPNRLYYISNGSASGVTYMNLMSIDTETLQTTVEHDFKPDIVAQGWPTTGPVRAGYPYLIGGANLRIWGLGAGGIGNINGALGLNVFGYDRQTNAIIRYADVPVQQSRLTTPFPLKSGNGLLWANGSTDTKVLDVGGHILRSLSVNGLEHADTQISAATGHDLFISAQYDLATGLNGNLIVADAATGVVQTLIGEATGDGYPRSGALVGAGSYDNPGWAVTGITGCPVGSNVSCPASANLSNPSPKTYLDQEIVVANADTGAVCRAAHHRSAGYYTSAPTNNYWAQTNVTMSPRGTRILFQSDWGSGAPTSVTIDPNAVVDTYVLELPAYSP